MRRWNLVVFIFCCYLLVCGCANVPEVETMTERIFRDTRGQKGFILENQALESVVHFPKVAEIMHKSSDPIFFKIIERPTSEAPIYTIEVLRRIEKNGSELLSTVVVDARTGAVDEKRSGP